MGHACNGSFIAKLGTSVNTTVVGVFVDAMVVSSFV